MKNYYSLLCFTLLSVFSFAQKVKLTEQTESFSVGSKNAIVITIPYGNKDVVEKEIKSLIKSWDGKYKDSKNEFYCVQGGIKSFGNKLFDAYAKMTEEKDYIQVALAVDLGGAFMTSREHNAQYKEFESAMKQLGKDCANKSVQKELELAREIHEDLKDDQQKLVKEKSELEKDIEDYKKKIADAENKIKENTSKQDRKTEEIKSQETVISFIENKLKSIQ